MAEGSPFAKARLSYIRERLNDSPDGCLLLSLNGFLNDEQKLAILICSPDNYRRLPVRKILAVPLTIWFIPILKRERGKNFLFTEAR